ncbi:MAG: alpha/beta fold hydrolase [Kiritimatiellia bacterium]
MRTLVAMSRRLAAQGAAVLRFDPRGCGDSPGSFVEFTLSDYRDDLCAAAHTLRQLYPQAPQVWLGVRSGAMLALQQATLGRVARPDALILWEPVTGPEFTRQILQRRQVNEMLAYGQARLGRQAAEAQLAGGATVDCDGFPITGKLYHELQQLLPGPWQGPGLVVSTSPDGLTADTCHRLAPATTRIHLRLPPFWNTVGHVDTGALTDATVAWINTHYCIATQQNQGSNDDGLQSETPSAPRNNATPCQAFPRETPDGAARMVSFAVGDGATLRGVLHSPSPSSQRRGRIVFLHGWSGDRTGPHRMFVQAARMLASLGFTSLRFDFRGRGDSDGITDQEATISSMTADTRAAIAWLQAEVPDGGPIILLAICSGCKVAISAASGEPSVARLVLWSAEAMGALRPAAAGTRKRLDTLRAYARKLLLADTWIRILRGHVRAGMVGKALAQTEVRSPEEAHAEDETLRAFRRFPGDMLFVFGGSDPAAAGASQAYARYCRKHGLTHTCHTVPHAGHSYYGLAWEQEVLQVTQAWLEDGRPRPRAGSLRPPYLPENSVTPFAGFSK